MLQFLTNQTGHLFKKTAKDLAQLLASSVSVFEDLKMEKLEKVLSFQKRVKLSVVVGL
jgi:hypothetical protein